MVINNPNEVPPTNLIKSKRLSFTESIKEQNARLASKEMTINNNLKYKREERPHFNSNGQMLRQRFYHYRQRS